MAKRGQYQATLDFLYRQLPMFQRIGPAAFKKDLSNTLALCAALGQPQERFPSIHVAGTNGKGSVAHFISAALQASGYRVGLYTSPHYRDFRERIKIDGQYVSRDYVVEFVERYHYLFEQLQPSFFEITVAMAFDYFAQSQVDVAVIEVGLGGRLDSTNVITPELSVITNISFDHMDFLGDTLPQIAAEKAGIIKPGIPVVIGESQPETAPVFIAKAAAEQAPIVFADQRYRAEIQGVNASRAIYDVHRDGHLYLEGLELDALGPYQGKNLQTALQALECLPARWIIPEAALRHGLSDLRQLTSMIGRWQTLGERPAILCDSAHNEAGMELAMAALRQIPHRQLHIVMGTVSDKDPAKLLRQMPREAVYYFARPDIPRGLDAEKLRQQAEALGLYGKAYSSVRQALRAARRHADPDDLIYVGGSIFVVAEVVH
jgi:dihydrofolate synthase / folylpolyglutamate synthase